jgi:hypothetical protein
MLIRKNIAPTENTPKVILDPEGVIMIKGRSMINNAAEFYKQIEEWIDLYVSNPADLTRVDICLEYFNGVNSIIFISLLKKITKVKLKDKLVSINWYYEEDDDDILAQGENISSVLDIPVNLILLSESGEECDCASLFTPYTGS